MKDALRKKLMGSSEKRERLMKDCKILVEEEVKALSGFTGLAIKSTYKMITLARPELLNQVLEALIDDWVEALEEYYEGYESAISEEKDFASYLDRYSKEVAEAWLQAVDKKAKGEEKTTLYKAYASLRPKAKTYVEHAVPRVGKMLQNYL